MRKLGLLILSGVLLMGAAVMFTTSQMNYKAPYTGSVIQLLTTLLSRNISCKDFGCAGTWNGATGSDDTASLQAAIAAVQLAPFTSTLHIPKGRFRTTAALTSSGINIIGEGGAAFNGSASTEIDCFGAGACLTFDSGNDSGRRLEGIKFVSGAAAQKGLVVLGSFNTIHNIGLREFDTAGLQMGIAATTGAYYADVTDVLVFNPTTQGIDGVLVSGGLPATNADNFRNVVVSGRFTNMYHIDGHKNVFYSGDCVPDTRGTGVANMWLINGVGNEVNGSYSELAAGATLGPSKYVTFGSTANSNVVRGGYLTMSMNLFVNQTSAISDSGWNNSVKLLPLSANFPMTASNTGVANLVPNSGFGNWVTTTEPLGWVVFAGTATKDTATTHGTAASLKVTAAGVNFTVQSYFASASAGDKSLNQIPIGYLQGKQITCSVWCKSSFAGIGNMRIGSNGTGGSDFGQMFHSGGGGWELLVATALVPTDATKAEISLRASNAALTLTGDVWFSEPTCVVGLDVPHYSPRPLLDTGAQLQAPIVEVTPIALAYAGTIVTDASLGNAFTVTATTNAAFFFQNPTNLKSGQRLLYTIRNTSGVALGAVTWGTTFKTAAFTAPATTFNRSVEFQYNGTNLVQLYQSAADVPN